MKNITILAIALFLSSCDSSHLSAPEMLDCVICYYVGGWRVMDLDAVNLVDDENPAEAAAEIYLKINQQ